MSYPDDVRSFERLQKLRIGAIVVAAALLVVSVAFDVSSLAWPRAIAWLVAAYAGVREGRALKRLGRDPDAAYLRALLFVFVAILCVV